MIKSMTAFGRAKSEGEDKDITVEIKSVNSRYFDCTVRAPRSASAYEDSVRAYLRRDVISRGKIEVQISYDVHSSGVEEVTLDLELAENYIKALRELKEKFDLKDDISVMTVARNSDIFSYRKAEADAEAEWERLLGVIREAAASYSAMRESEGKKTEEDIRAKLAGISAMVDEVEVLSEGDKSDYRDRLEARLRKVLSDEKLQLDEQRILTECAIFADKVAVDEEIVRLRSHIRAFEEISREREPSGRKLDFLMQELNRETNTIGSKACNSRVAHIVVSIKGELEKIREQVQNIE